MNWAVAAAHAVCRGTKSRRTLPLVLAIRRYSCAIAPTYILRTVWRLYRCTTRQPLRLLPSYRRHHYLFLLLLTVSGPTRCSACSPDATLAAPALPVPPFSAVLCDPPATSCVRYRWHLFRSRHAVYLTVPRRGSFLSSSYSPPLTARASWTGRHRSHILVATRDICHGAYTGLPHSAARLLALPCIFCALTIPLFYHSRGRRAEDSRRLHSRSRLTQYTMVHVMGHSLGVRHFMVACLPTSGDRTPPTYLCGCRRQQVGAPRHATPAYHARAWLTPYSRPQDELACLNPNTLHSSESRRGSHMGRACQDIFSPLLLLCLLRFLFLITL